MNSGSTQSTRVVLAAAVLLTIAGCAVASQAAPPGSTESPPASRNEDLAFIRLDAPESPNARAYLGLQDAKTFSIGDIQTRILLIEVFSMYCPHCQREAPAVNTLYQQIIDRGDLADRIKIIGIGVGNSSFEVGVFQKTYNVPFPLFPDPSMEISQRLGAVRTPTFVGVRIEPGGALEQFLLQAGGFDEPESFLNTLIEKSGLLLEP